MSGDDPMVRPLDHVVVAVRDADIAGATYERLGFQVVPLMRHIELGCCNRVIQLQGSYIELLGDIDSSVPALRERLEPRLACGEGIVLSSLRSQDLESDRLKLLQAGLEPGGIFSARRKVPMPDGSELETDSRALYPWQPRRPFATVFYTEHRKPEAIWTPAYQSHPNSAVGIAKLIYVTDDTLSDADYVVRLPGAVLKRITSESASFVAGPAHLEFLSRAAALQRFAAVNVPVCDSQPVLGMALEVKVADLDRCARVLAENGVDFERQAGRIRVPALQGCGVVLDFMT